MNYTACEPKCESVPTVDNVKNDNILALVTETKNMSCDIQLDVSRISSFLFGVQPLNDAKRKDPECLMDELETVKSNLLETARELHDLCVMLGM